MSRRGLMPKVPEPMRVCDLMIDKCRREIDSPTKKQFRRLVNRILSKRNALDEMGEGTQLGLATRVPLGSRIGRYAYIGHGFSAPSPISVGDLCMISTNVTIVANDHGVDDPQTPMRLSFRWTHSITTFEADVWVGHGAIIRSGITVGRGAVIGAGAIVTKDVEPYAVLGGGPARLIRKRFNDQNQMLHDHIIYGGVRNVAT
jgi:chloramphenicol O-acetyltransferase type B